MRAVLLALTTAALIGALPAQAQQGLATSSTIGGHNTIQQAPSGGTNKQAIGGDEGSTAGDAVQPTEAEKQEEQHNNAVTDICKGC